MKTGTMHLPTLSAVALFECEIKGQLSDGAWENTMPLDHWKFWYDLETVYTPGCAPHVETDVPYLCLKKGYNIAGLYEYVGDRMRNYGKLGLAAQRLGMTAVDKKIIKAGEYMPVCLNVFKWLRDGTYTYAAGGDYPEYHKNYHDAVPMELATEYYKTVYLMKELRSDVRLIKAAMKTVKR